jgi:transposase
MNQDFTTLYPNQKWVMDITYIWTVYDGWTYLASVMDLHSKMIIGYSYQRHMKQEIVLESLRQAVYKTKQTKGIIVQSDLGSQYLSYDVEQFIDNYEMIHSYSRKGTPYDNAPIETFHSIIKRERLSRMTLKHSKKLNWLSLNILKVFIIVKEFIVPSIIKHLIECITQSKNVLLNVSTLLT